MDYLMFIDRTGRALQEPPPVRFMVSGSDAGIRRTVLGDVLRQARGAGQPLIVISDGATGESEDLGALAAYGYRVENGMSGDYFLYDPFRKISAVKGLSRIRQLVSVMEYDEHQKGRLISYLSFIRHLECLAQGINDADLTMDVLAGYSTVEAVEERLQDLAGRGIITAGQQRQYLAKYAECAAAGADFENLMFLLMPFTREEGGKPGTDPGTAVVFPTGALGEDENLQNLILKLLQFGLEDGAAAGATVLVFDKGYGSRKGIAALLNALPADLNVHIFSNDIFTLCQPELLAMILNRFTARVYSRPLTMTSAGAIEKACGDIEVVKTTYSASYDRRWRANSPLDILLGNNKTESYGKTAPVREPRYRKEMILSLAPGTGIVEYMGSSTVFSIR